MDVDVARWVLEFLMRESVDDRVVNALIRVLPLSGDHPGLKKTLLLRGIESVIASGSVSEKILELLELIEELDYQERVAASDAMKAAYCAVAVDCTLSLLDESEDSASKYFDAVKRIWRGRVRKMEKSERPGLVSDELRSWKEEVEEAIWDVTTCEKLRTRNKENDAVEAVRVFVAESWERMGPPFLQLLVQTMNYDELREVLNLDSGAKGVESLPDSVTDGDKGIKKAGLLIRRKMLANRRSQKAISGTSRGVKITDAEEMGVKTRDKYKCPTTPEVNKVQEALKSSVLELQAVVKDPLPDALQLAETVMSGIESGNLNQEPLVADQSRNTTNPSAEAVQANQHHCGNQYPGHQNMTSRPNLMERNSTAQTFEWDDSVDDLPEGPSRPHLPSPKRRVVSPLKKYGVTKLVRRRKVKKWSLLEEDTLRTGVQRYGRGNWKLILNSYRDIFEERTEVDLKDKWRNMIR